MNENASQRQPEVDIAYINAKTRLAITLACGGMLSLVIGMVVILFGASSPETATFQIGGIEITATGIGAVIMATSVMWAYFAYKVRPTYSSSHRVTHKVSTDGTEEFHHEMDTTQVFQADEINKAIKGKQNDA